MSLESSQQIRPTYLDGLIARFQIAEPYSTKSQDEIEAKKRAKEARNHQKQLANWYAMERWDHLRTLSDLAVYLAPAPIQRKLEEIIPASKIQGYHRSKDPFQIYPD